MDTYSVSNNRQDDNIIKVFVNNKFHKDDIVFDFINEYEWSSETKKYLSQIKINSLKQRGSSLVKYFSQFRKQ
tara:strand:+ start:3577 stop:3795 length:219 start_codon:yes stop_codon:yes gene_type:complete